ncbi:unnamed protein product [Sphagnum tenellum]
MRFYLFQRSKFGSCTTTVSLPCCRCVLLSQVIGKRTRPWLRTQEDKSPTPLLSPFNPSHISSLICSLKFSNSKTLHSLHFDLQANPSNIYFLPEFSFSCQLFSPSSSVIFCYRFLLVF